MKSDLPAQMEYRNDLGPVPRKIVLLQEGTAGSGNCPFYEFCRSILVVVFYMRLLLFQILRHCAYLSVAWLTHSGH